MLLKIRTKFAKSFFSLRRLIVFISLFDLIGPILLVYRRQTLPTIIEISVYKNLTEVIKHYRKLI